MCNIKKSFIRQIAIGDRNSGTTLNIKFRLLIFLLTFTPFFALSQASEQVATSSISKPTLVFNSPEASSLGRYGDIPVGLSTGVPDIQVPIYTIALKDFKVPVYLSYHSSGIKVEDIASNTGLGWTLNYGGAITQSVNGLPDDGYKGWLSVPQLEKTPQNTFLRTQWSDIDWQTDPDFDYLVKASQVKFDTKPDLYYVSLLGRNFKYFYSQGGTIYTIPYQKVTIGNRVIKDENDNIFEFERGEGSRTHSVYFGTLNEPDDATSTTLYLTKITTPSGGTVTYEYENYEYSFNNQISETRYSRIPNQQGCTNCTQLPSHVESVTYVNGVRIKRILASTGIEITFNYDLNRQDLQGTKALTGVRIKDVNNPNDPSKNLTLSYGYYVANNQSENSTNPNDYRLKLLSVTEQGSKPWIFSYNENPLPSRLSYSQDHWGYYNAHDAGTLLPSDDARGFTTGADRSPNQSVIQNGILKKITYPTGGSTTFDYEPNTTYSSRPVNGIYKSAVVMAQNNTTITVPFTVVNGDATTFKVYYNAGLADGSLRYLDPESDEYGNCEIRLKDASGNTVKLFYGTSDIQGEIIPGLPDGNYTLIATTSGPGNQAVLNASVTWFTSSGNVISNYITGGVRVRTITENPIIGTPLSKYFEYVKDSTPLQSSGIEHYYPEYVHDHFVELVGNDYSGTPSISRAYWFDCKFYAQNSTSVMPLGTIMGGPAAYTEVNTYTGIKTNGYTNNKLSVAYSGPSGWAYPMPPIINDDWASGLPLETIDYKWKGDSQVFTPIKKTVNHYEFNNPANLHVVRGTAIAIIRNPFHVVTMFNVQLPEPLNRGPEVAITYFNFTSSWFYKDKTTVTDYNPIDSNKKVITETSYFFENPTHIQVTRQEVTRNDGSIYKLLFKYPQDFNASYLYNSTPIIEKRVLINDGGSDRLVRGELIRYIDHSGSFPSEYYTLKSTSPVSTPMFDGSNINSNYEKRQEYSYNTNNDLVNLVKPNGPSVCYLWGYNHQFPIAEIKNASYQDVVNVLGQNVITQLDTNTPSDLVQLRNRLAPLRTDSRLKNALVTTYTYSPLVGMTSSTDAKGMTTTYEYDSFQRLMNVKDRDGNIIKHNDYHYQNQ
jgi:YD repeat-containing protein